MSKSRHSVLLTILLALKLAIFVTACGQRGPLYLPDETSAPNQAPHAEDALEAELDEEDDLRDGNLQHDNSVIGTVDEAVDET